MTVRDIDKGAKALLKRVSKSKRTITVGVHSEEGAETKEGGKSVAEIAEFNEFGMGPPARPAITGWADEERTDNEEELRKAGVRIVKGMDPNQALEQVGLLFVGHIQERIASGIPPENAQSTIDQKGSSTPLIDTGQFRSSINHKVT